MFCKSSQPLEGAVPGSLPLKNSINLIIDFFISLKSGFLTSFFTISTSGYPTNFKKVSFISSSFIPISRIKEKIVFLVISSLSIKLAQALSAYNRSSSSSISSKPGSIPASTGRSLRSFEQNEWMVPIKICSRLESAIFIFSFSRALEDLKLFSSFIWNLS